MKTRREVEKKEDEKDVNIFPFFSKPLYFTTERKSSFISFYFSEPFYGGEEKKD